MPRLTRARSIGLAALGATAALAVFVSTSAGSNSSTHRTASYRTVRVRAVGRFAYPASNVVTLQAHKSGEGTINCPAAHPHPVGGQFSESTGKVFLASSFAAKKGWTTELYNSGTTAAKTQIGAVCAP